MNIDERAASLVGDMPWITEHLTDAQIGDMKRQIAASMRALTAAEPQDPDNAYAVKRDPAFPVVEVVLAERKDGGE